MGRGLMGEGDGEPRSRSQLVGASRRDRRLAWVPIPQAIQGAGPACAPRQPLYHDTARDATTKTVAPRLTLLHKPWHRPADTGTSAMADGNSARPTGPTAFAEARGAGIVQLARDILAFDRQALAILLTVPVVLTLLEYFGLPWHYTRWSERTARITAQPPASGADWMLGLQLPKLPGLSEIAWLGLQPYLWWVLACLVLLVLVPLVVAAAVGISPARIGLRWTGTLRDARTYLSLYVLFVPVIWLASRQPGFQNTYPFYKPTGMLGLDFVYFELMYCLQFLAIELFFRGFMVLGLKPRLGSASVLVMLAPYCMIHYYKPFPEAMGAIGAGLVLGILAWRTGTILYGWCVHYAVALSMDLFALHQRGWL